MMRGTKRFSGSDSNDSLFQGKRVFAGLQTDSGKLESSQTQQPQVSTLPLDMQRAELSRQHVRALNTQFASWVQLQLQNHPDELWKDGAQDYLNHASNIMEKFSDVVNWLKANLSNGGTGLISGSEQKNSETDSYKSGTVVTSLTGSTGSVGGFGGQNDVLSNGKGVDKTCSDTGNALNGATSIVDNKKSGGDLPSTTGIFGGSWGSGVPKGSENKQIGNNLSSDKANNTPASTTPSFGGTSPIFGTTPSFSGTSPSFGTTPSFGSSWGFGGSKGSENKQIGDNLSSEKASNIPASTFASFGSTTSSFAGSAPSFGTTTSFGGTSPSFGSSWGFGGSKDSENTQIGDNLSSDKASNIPASKIASFGSTNSSLAGSAPSFGGSLSSGTSFNNNSPFSFGIQTSAASSQNSMPIANSAANEEQDGEDADEQQPGSPSVKKTEEKGIMVVHEVKCKLYVKSTDPANAWKDKGTGQLSIKCKEGVTKGTKDSKPTIIVRNDVGKVLLNALLYPGIKTNLQKNAVVAIFHSSGDGDDVNNVVAQTFLLRTKTGEDRDNLAAAIKEYAPTA